MNTFSERHGLKLVRTDWQIDSIDSDLRNSLWNALIIHYWAQAKGIHLDRSANILYLFNKIWVDYYKIPLDTMPDWGDSATEQVKVRFFKCEWNEVYDFIEFVANNQDDENSQKFTQYCNSLLERELSAYRFVANKITPITSEEEITEIEEAIDAPLKIVTHHLQRSLELFADRKSPDYRNSIKEAISAVEAICTKIVGDPKSTLGQALDKIEKQGKLRLHPALRQAFDKLYGYTSAADGIRHALLNESTLGFDDAKFMLVSCSAFINYLKSKASNTGIEL